MSSVQKPVSEGVSGPPEHASVFDFLYYDAKRVGSYLAQLDPDGHLTGFTRTEATTRVSSHERQQEGSGTAGILAGKLGSKEGSQSSAGDTAARVYDALWAGPLAFLDFAAQRQLLADVPSAQLGQFVIARGTLSVIDMIMMQRAWEAPAIKKQILSGAQQGGPKGQAKLEAQQQTAFALDMIKMMPHGVQGQLVTGSDFLWMTLDPGALTTPVGDLMLKHGVTLAGEWYVVAILDALPDDGASTAVADMAAADIFAAAAALASTPIGVFAQALAPMARMFMGRSAIAHGVTPILIFRSVTAA